MPRRNRNPNPSGDIDPDYAHFLDQIFPSPESALHPITDEEHIVYGEALYHEEEEIGTDDDEEDDEEGTTDDEEEDSESEEDGEQGEEEVVVLEPTTTSMVSNEAVTSQPEQVSNNNKRKRTTEEEAEAINLSLKDKEGCGEWNRTDMEGLFCPICMEAWTSGGDHQVSCLPCGHLYGMSCIKKWLQQRRSAAKCPQCNKKCGLKDIRRHYESRITVVDEESKKRAQALETKCTEFIKREGEWLKKEKDWHTKEAELLRQLAELRATKLECHFGDRRSMQSCADSSGGSFRNIFPRQRAWSFMLKGEFRVDGARIFDLDSSSQISVVARRLAAMDGMHILTKVSLFAPHDTEDIMLPSSTRAVKDLHFSNFDDRLVLLASLGKKLSVVSTESNNVVLTYDLPAPAWSCSWDVNSSHYVYAGLQNGMLLMFDTRQTSQPVQSMCGLTSNPVHTIHPLSCNLSLSSGSRSILTASSVGISQWNLGGTEERTYLITEENQGICISFAHSSKTDGIVASFRPKIETCNEIALSQTSPTPPHATGQGVQGCHVHYKRAGDSCYQKSGSSFANLDKIRLPKSVIMDVDAQCQVFVSIDDSSNELVVQELPHLSVVQRLRCEKYPIRDLKSTHAGGNQAVLNCLCDDTLQSLAPPPPPRWHG